MSVSAVVDAPTATDCPTCDHADREGWFGSIAPARTHCRGCHRFWASLREAHCTGCHAHFSNHKAFDFHKAGGGCTPPEELVKADGRPRLVARQRRFGVVWSVAFYGTRPDHWKDDEDEADGT